jgi:glutathione S-transferase
MDWFNTGLYRDLGYGLIYTQVLPDYKRQDDKVQAATIAWSREKAKGWLKILDENLIGPRNAYVGGSEITLADYLGSAYLTVGEVIRLDCSAYPNICRWLNTMKARPNWAKVNEGFYAHFVTPFKDAPFEGL